MTLTTINKTSLKRVLLLFTLMLLHFFPVFGQGQNDYAKLAKEVERCLEKGIAYMQSLAIEGGYVYHYTLDGKERWGEGKTDNWTIEVQPPGTPAVGMRPIFCRLCKTWNNGIW